jgi:hypothetical protein
VLVLLVFAPMRGLTRSERRTRARIERTPGLGTQWAWLDLWSTRDLVPDGPLHASNNRGEQVITSLEVDNAGPWISDHVTYLSNPGQVIPLIYGVAANASRLKDSTLTRHVSWTWQHRGRRASSRGRGGRAPALPQPVYGKEKVARLFLRAKRIQVSSLRHVEVNGQPGALLLDAEDRSWFSCRLTSSMDSCKRCVRSATPTSYGT